MAIRVPTAIVVCLLGTLLLCAGCASVGRPFPVAAVSQIRVGETTREEVRDLFGEPWRTGIEDGKRTWTYAHYRYSLFGGVRTRDLYLRFNDEGVVVSYAFNSTYPEDRRP